MRKEPPALKAFLKTKEYFMPSVSVDNVIFGFHENQLKVLLLQLKKNNKWKLPGGFIYKDEEIEDAAARILKIRTGLDKIFLQQFHVFGDSKRTPEQLVKEMFDIEEIRFTEQTNLLQRYLTIGYYALVEYDKVKPHLDKVSIQCTWYELNNLPELLFDHRQIIEQALQTLRIQLNFQPIGYNLLPKEFTLKYLQSIYETILGRKLDRSNFNRKILSYGILVKKGKQYSGAAHKAPYLYSFNKKAYFKALENGLDKNF
jgi:ADP-ribose pyrophosphatase YjhB (NUDIX family)